LSRRREAIELSEDHKPDLPGEKQRVENAGFRVQDGRVDGDIATSRAFGDFSYKNQIHLPAEKQAVTCFPDITIRTRSADDEFIILACDGIWDCMGSQKCVEYLTDFTNKTKPTEDTCHLPVEEMLDFIISPVAEKNGSDNMTAILIWLQTDSQANSHHKLKSNQLTEEK